MSSNYLKVVYDNKSHPYTDYPKQLCSYLFQSFGFKSGMKMLEPGCGRGEFLNNFMKLGIDVCGIDISSESKDFGHNFPIDICDIENESIPYSDNHFDIIFSKSFIEHLYKPEIFLDEAYRVLKPKGKFLTLVPDWESNYKIYFDDYTHRSPFSSQALNDAYKIHGFSDVKVFKLRQLPIVWKYPILNYLCSAISPAIPVRTKNKFLRWSRELMLVGYGTK